MQKKLIALAVAGLVAAPVAMAQSNVTVYGAVDMGIQQSKVTGQKSVFKVEDSQWGSSQLGFRGSEDLGNGLKAVFQIEMGVSVEEQANLSTSRNTFLGLEGGFGSVTLGRFDTPLATFDGAYQANGSNAFEVDALGSARKALTTRIPNFVRYLSPNMNGLVLGAAFGADEDANVKSDVMGVAARYATGPFSVSYAYHEIRNNVDVHWVGASYDFGMAKVVGQFARGDRDANPEKETEWSLGLAIPVSEAGKFTVAYGAVADNNGVKDHDKNNWALTYSHSLSKRTALYAGYKQEKDEPAGGPDVKTRTIGTGIAHKF